MNDYRIAVFMIFIAMILIFNCNTYENFSCDLECLTSEEKETRKKLLMTLKQTKEILTNMFSVNFNESKANEKDSKTPQSVSYNKTISTFEKIEDLSSLSSIELSSYLDGLNQSYYSSIEKIQKERTNVFANIDEIERDLNENLHNNFQGNCNIYSITKTEYCSTIVSEETNEQSFIQTDLNIRRFEEKFKNLIQELRTLNKSYIYIAMLRKEFGRVATKLNNFSKDIFHDSSVIFFE